MNLKDEIFPLFKAAWDAQSPALNGGTAPTVVYDTIFKNDSPPADEVYATIRVLSKDGAEIAPLSPGGAGLWIRSGTVEVSVYVPIGSTAGAQLADVARGSLQGKVTEGGVILRDVSIVEAGLDGPWYRWDLTASFDYDEAV
jgi:hypothetical protein